MKTSGATCLFVYYGTGKKPNAGIRYRLAGLPDATQQFVSKKEAKEAVSLHHLISVKKEMEGKTKCGQIYKRDIRKMQDFMLDKSLKNARMEVLWLTDMLNTRSTMKGGTDNMPAHTAVKEGI